MTSLSGKIEKQFRYWRWRLSAGVLPMWWHVGRPNFGDDLTPDLFHRLTGAGVRFEPNRSAPHVLGMGSILSKATPASIICGSGLIAPTASGIRARAVAVRGELSLRALASPPDDLMLGDPAVLVSQLVTPPARKRHPFGFVPHVRSVDRWRAWNFKGHKLIDPAAPAWKVVDEIAACETIVSQSLHGLIVADALGIPNVWVAPSANMMGGRFKFDDYFTTIDAPKEMVLETPDIFSDPRAFTASLGHYRFDKAAYRARLGTVCAELTSSLRAK
ncbi:MAG: polysaccharide pyruvyl transferase family protein [Mesorhizobium sp.]